MRLAEQPWLPHLIEMRLTVLVCVYDGCALSCQGRQVPKPSARRGVIDSIYLVYSNLGSEQARYK